jgi:hypothetical protein
MKRLGFCALLLGALVSVIAAQSQPGGRAAERASARPAGVVAAPERPLRHVQSAVAPVAAHRTLSAADVGAPAAAATFEKYCSDCHTGSRAKGGINFDTLTERMTSTAVGEKADAWDDVVHMLESRDMPPPDDADDFPTDAERASTVAWIRTALSEFDSQHAGEPGRVTVRRLTSAEYAYAIHDLTGFDIKTGIDASSDSVGGEGFANFGDVQSVQDTTVERYLEAAKTVADHAVIGSGPLAFFSDSGETGLELSALDRINNLYASKGFRVVSGEGGRPFGFERYAKALYVAWYFKHRAALGDPNATVRGLAAKEGITGRFADHMWEVVNKTTDGYPSHDMIAAWRRSTRRRPTSRRRRPRRAPRPRRSPRSWSPGRAGSSPAATWPPAARATRRRCSSTTPRSTSRRSTATLRPQPEVRPARARRAAPDLAADRSGAVDGLPDVRRAEQGHRRSGGHLPQPARRPADAGHAAAAVRAGGDHAGARARAGAEDVPAARDPAGGRDRPAAVRRQRRRHAGRPERLRARPVRSRSS